MATLSVLKFPTADGAQQTEGALLCLQKQQLLTIHDAAIVTWPQGAKQPKTRQLHSMAGAGALQGAFWGMLFGLIFFVPFFGLAVGAAMGALSGKFADYGIDDNFIKQTREKVTEGTSALFLLSSGAVMDKLTAELKGVKFEIISTNLSPRSHCRTPIARPHPSLWRPTSPAPSTRRRAARSTLAAGTCSAAARPRSPPWQRPQPDIGWPAG